MPHYKDKNNNLHFLNDESFEHMLPAGSAKLTEAEVDALRAPTFDQVKAQKLNELAAYRYGKETAGVSIGGMTVKTDRESQSMLAGAKVYSDMNESVLIDWKAENGWVQIDRTVILAVSQAVATHIQACFSREKVHGEAIEALTTVEDIAAYDFTTGWPAFIAALPEFPGGVVTWRDCSICEDYAKQERIKMGLSIDASVVEKS
jgi:hypothetical protein